MSDLHDQQGPPTDDFEDGYSKGWDEALTKPHLVPEYEALSDGERDCAVVLKWWQDLAISQGARAERAEDQTARLKEALEECNDLFHNENIRPNIYLFRVAAIISEALKDG